MTGKQSCQEEVEGVRKAVGRCMHCSRIVCTDWVEKQSSEAEEIETVVRLLDDAHEQVLELVTRSAMLERLDTRG